MCATCGCADTGYRVDGRPHADGRTGPGTGHTHAGGCTGPGTGHTHADGHTHAGGRTRPGRGVPRTSDGHPPAGDGQESGGRTVAIQERVLARNDALAAQNRQWLAEREILAVNLMSSPGSGKTTLLERTARDLAGQAEIAVIEGDQETDLDAARVRAAGCRVVQVNTGVGCHLDAAMVASALRALGPSPGSVVVIENVGNLVCPALFDLGESARVVLASVPEGADKPAKYPAMFRRADLVLLTKTDLLPYLDFSTSRYEAAVRRASPGAMLAQVSAVTGEGLAQWYAWLRQRSGQPPGSHP